MQSSIRDRRSYGSNLKLRKHKVARLRKITVLLGTALVLFSCSHTKTNNIKKPFESLCLSGEGKGRITYSDGKYVFSYDSLLNQEEEEWALGLQLPLHGEEVLRLKYKDAFDSKLKIGGTFFKRLSYAAKKENKDAELIQLKKVLTKMGVFLKTVQMVRAGELLCAKGQCLAGKRHAFSLSESNDELNASFPFDSNHKFIIHARSNSPYYRKINFILKDRRLRSGARQPFALSLIHQNCTNE